MKYILIGLLFIGCNNSKTTESPSDTLMVHKILVLEEKVRSLEFWEKSQSATLAALEEKENIEKLCLQFLQLSGVKKPIKNKDYFANSWLVDVDLDTFDYGCRVYLDGFKPKGNFFEGYTTDKLEKSITMLKKRSCK